MMGINIEVEDPYSDKKQICSIDAEDLKLLVNLLHEYSDKLTLCCQELEWQEYQEKFIPKCTRLAKIICNIITQVVGVLSLIVSLIIIGSILIDKYQILRSGKLDPRTIISILLVGSLQLLLQTWLYSLTHQKMDTYEGNLSLIQREARGIAYPLEKVMNITIEIGEKIDINMCRKLELDLRVSDTQTSLNYYRSIIK